MKKQLSDFYGFMYSLVISNLTVVILLTIIVIMLGFVTKKIYSKDVKDVVVDQVKSEKIVVIDKTKYAQSNIYTVEYVIENKKGIFGDLHFYSYDENRCIFKEYLEKEEFTKNTYPPILIKKWSYKFNVRLSSEFSDYFPASLKFYTNSDTSGKTYIKLYIDGKLIDEDSGRSTLRTKCNIKHYKFN